MSELTQKIKRFALEEAGFDAVGVTGPVLPEPHAQAFGSWLAEGRAGTMDYMARSPERRSDARLSLASAKSVISLAVNYFHPEDPRPAEGTHGKVAKYAYGRD
jgi:epoxyqueuosine reductase